jgi:hypothetical protein
MADTKNMAVQYAMMKKKKKMAEGGAVEDTADAPQFGYNGETWDAPPQKPHEQMGPPKDDENDRANKPESGPGSFAMGGDTMDMSKMTRRERAMMMAEGGEAKKAPMPESAQDDGEQGGQDPLHEMDMVTRIMHKRYPEHFAEGGEVKDEEPTAGFESNDFDELDRDPPETAEADDTGANSGDEIGDEQEDDDRKDIVSRIMKSRAKKDRNPSPA